MGRMSNSGGIGLQVTFEIADLQDVEDIKCQRLLRPASAEVTSRPKLQHVISSLEVTQTPFWTLVAEFKNDRKALRW